MNPEFKEPFLKCYCGSDMALRKSKYGPVYGCARYPECDGAIGMHPDGTPLGVPADKETRTKRIEAHEVFDELWKSLGAPYTRTQAYFEMRCMMGLSDDEAHIANFTKEQCERMIEKVHQRITRLAGDRIGK